MKHTLPIIEKTLKSYVDKLFQIDVETDSEFIAAVKKAKDELLADIVVLRDQNPELFYLNYEKTLGEDSAKEIIKKISKNAFSHYGLDTLPSTEFFIDKVQGDTIVTPSFVPTWDTTYVDLELPQGAILKDVLNSFLLNLMLSLPIKKINLTFVDLDNSFLTDYIYKNIDSSLYHEKPISDVETLRMFLHSMNERILNNVKLYGNLHEYNKKNKTIAQPYEIIILFDEDKKFLKDQDECLRELDAVKKNGEKAGIYIINFKKIDREWPKDVVIGITPLTSIPALCKACVDYINIEAKKEEETQIIALDTSKLKKTSFMPLDDSLSVPIGRSGSTDVLLKMEVGGIRAHTFIIGQSGSGKSVLLHNIISGAMLNYSPEDLELYLLDFKLGGVEFNRYKGEKHVRAMLVDNSDIQVTLEILRDLKERMAQRGRKLREAGVNTLKEYNTQCPNERMKRILFIADECHEMFRVDENNRSASKEISNILTMVVKEGRSQGVHLLLATQTLANTEIGSDILANIGNHLMLKCSIADSEKLVPKSSDITSKLNTGFVYYSEENTKFQAFYADKKQAAEIIQTINDKTKSLTSNETFYFSGASIFHFDSYAAIQNHARKCRKMPVAFAGKSIDIKQVDVAIPLNEDFSENILLLGLNDEFQSTRTSMNLLVSLLATCKAREADVDFKIINYLSDENDKYLEVLDKLENADLIDVIPAKKRAPLFKQLAEDVLAGKAKETILFILGQDRFRELKLDLELEEESSASDDSGLMGINSSFLTDSSSKKKSVTSFSEAMNAILDKGPEVGVHTIIQLEKAANYLFTDYISQKDLFQKFKHLILLKSDENAATQLHIRNDIHLENLSKEEDRLRAYYYAEESDTYTLFTPYMPLEGKDLTEYIKTL